MIKNQKKNETDVKKVVLEKTGKVSPDRLTYLLLFSNIFFVCVIGYILTGINFERNKTSPRMADCADLYRGGHRKNDVYEIQPTPEKSSKFQVYCDMERGGWTVIMRREASDRSAEFNRPLENYKTGFGDLKKNHWLGLERINWLSVDKVRDMMFFIDGIGYKVHGFRVDNEYNHWKLTVESEIDKMTNDCSFLRLNNTRFTTHDIDFDMAPDGECAKTLNAGWWFTNCYDKSVVMTALHLHSKAGVTQFSKGLMMIK